MGKQPLYGPIYSLKLVELETLKTYIKTNLARGWHKNADDKKNLPTRAHKQIMQINHQDRAQILTTRIISAFWYNYKT